MAVITISRQFGSGGLEITNRVCELLGYRYLDKLLMAQVAAEVGLCGPVHFGDEWKGRNANARLHARIDL